MTKRYHFDVTSNKTKDMQRRLDRIKKHAHNRHAAGDEAESVTIQKRKSKIKITLRPITWKQVLIIAFCYALMINIVKHLLYAAYGTPSYTFSDPKLEAEFQYLHEKYSGEKEERKI